MVLSEAGSLSSSQRIVALGGERRAPKQLSEGCRWVGGEDAEIDETLVSECAEGTEGGKITDLNFHYKFLRRIENLADYAPQLRSLDLSSNNLRILENLGAMPKLLELKLDACQISRIEGLEKCPSLVSLHLEDNEIACVEGLEKLFSLETLNLERNKIQRLVRGFTKLSKLKELRLAYNDLTSLDGLQGLGSLEVLDVSQNKLETISAEHLKGLGKLDELLLSGNRLSAVGFLNAPGPVRLSSLDLSENNLSTSSFKGFPNLPLLSELMLAGNHLEELPTTLSTCCPTLEILDISRNLISAPLEVEKLKCLSSLKELCIEGNPMSESDALPKALLSLEGLEYLENRQFVPPKQIMLEDGEQICTFGLTTVEAAKASSSSRPQTAEGSRPGTAALSRPGTGLSRPPTASKEAVQQPLMHAAPTSKTSRKCASSEQVTSWEQQTLCSLHAIKKQVEKTSLQVDQDLQEMHRYVKKARDANLRYEYQVGRMEADSIPEEEELVRKYQEPMGPPTPGRASQKLRQVTISYRVEEEDEDEAPAAARSIAEVKFPVSRSTLSVCKAQADEVEEVAMEVEVESNADPELPEIEEEVVQVIQAAAAAQGKPPAGKPGTELRVQKRAARRANSAGRSLGPKGPYPRLTSSGAGYPGSR